MLGAGNGTSVLDTGDGVGESEALEVGVGAEALGVAATLGETTKRTGSRAEDDVDTLVAGLRAQGVTTIAPEVTAEVATNGQGGRESAVVVAEAQAEGTVLHAQALEAHAGDGADVADALAAHPANAGGQVDLFGEGQLGDESLGLGVGVLPSGSLGVHPRRRVDGRRVGDAVDRALDALGAIIGVGAVALRDERLAFCLEIYFYSRSSSCPIGLFAASAPSFLVVSAPLWPLPGSRPQSRSVGDAPASFAPLWRAIVAPKGWPSAVDLRRGPGFSRGDFPAATAPNN